MTYVRARDGHWNLLTANIAYVVSVLVSMVKFRYDFAFKLRHTVNAFFITYTLQSNILFLFKKNVITVGTDSVFNNNIIKQIIIACENAYFVICFAHIRPCRRIDAVDNRFYRIGKRVCKNSLTVTACISACIRTCNFVIIYDPALCCSVIIIEFFNIRGNKGVCMSAKTKAQNTGFPYLTA